MDSQGFQKSREEPHAEIQAKSEKPMEAFMEQVYDDGGTCCSTTSSSSSSVSPSIFRTPFPGFHCQEPQLVSLGPYHCTRNLPLQKYKYLFLNSFISRTKSQDKDLSFYVQQMMSLEWRAKRCYSEELSMSSSEFVEMMLLDGCFVMEILGQFGGGPDWVFPIEPWQLPILVQDLLILENQIPFFVLKVLFESLGNQERSPTVSLCTMALKFFDLAFPRSMDISCEFDNLEPHHLLDLFLQSIRPSDPSYFHMKTTVFPKFFYSHPKKTGTRNQADVSKKAENVTNPKLKGVQHEQQCDPPPFHLTKNVTELQASGIKLRPRNAAKFTDIDLNHGVLEIPSVTIDDLFIAILINCVAFEHVSKTGSKDLTAYVSFMSRLIRRPTDAEILYSNGIISGFSHVAPTVAESFNLLWMNISDIDEHSYLSERLKELECYHTRYGKTQGCWSFGLRYRRTLFFSITNLLLSFNRLRSAVNVMIHSVQQVKFNGMYPDFEGDITCPQDYSSFVCDFVFYIARFIYIRTRGRVKSVDLSLGKFTAFFFLNIVLVIIMFKCREPTLTVDKQVIEDEVPVTVDEQVEDSGVDEKHGEAEDGHIEVEDSMKRIDTSGEPWFLDTVSGEWGNEMIVDCVSKDTTENYYNEPWKRIFEHEVVRMLVSALRVM